MKKMECEICRGHDIVKEDGMFVCRDCGCKYSLEEARKLFIEINEAAMQGAYTENDDNTATFGTYLYTFGAARQPITWQILAREGSRVLLISRDGIDCKPLHREYEDVTWAECSLRGWLNSAFLLDAFTPEQAARIVTADVPAHGNPEHSEVEAGEPTQDKVFILSPEEAERYFPDKASRRCEPTPFALHEGAQKAGIGTTWWWLRAPGGNSCSASFVFFSGALDTEGNDANNTAICVRPVMWVETAP